MARGLALAWTKHTRDAKEQEAVANSIKASGTMRERLLSILNEQMELIDTQEISIKDFEDPNWSHKQAFRNGKRSSLTYLKELLSFDRNDSI